MIEILKNHLVSRIGEDHSHLDLVLSRFTPMELPRNQFLLRQGEVCKSVYFVVRGCLQVFVYDHDMNETTRDLVTEESWCTELISFGNQIPATEHIKTVEPTQLLAIDKEGFLEMMEKVPQFEKVYRQVLETSYANSVYRINTFVSLSALDRMRWLMEYRPKLMNRVSSRLLASYLGIHKDVFSRLKAKL